jgi:MFS family permease
MTGPAGGTKADVGIYAGLLAALEIPFMLFWSWYAGKSSISKALATALLIYTVYAVLMAFASTPWHLYAMGVLNSAGAAAVLSLPLSAFQNLFQDRPGLGTSLLPVMSFIGGVLSSAGFAIGTWVGGYSGTAFVIAALCLFGAFSLFALEPRAPRAKAL